MSKRISFLVYASFSAALASSVVACKPRLTPVASLKDDGASSGNASGLAAFPLEPTGKLSRKLGARLATPDLPSAGCAHAARYVITASPGRKKISWSQNRGDLKASLKAVNELGNFSWATLEEWVTLPTYTFMACKGTSDYPTLAEAPKELLGSLRERSRSFQQSGLRTVFVIATAEDAVVTPGVLAAVKTELGKNQDIVVKEVALHGLPGLQNATQEAQSALGQDIADTDALIIWAYGFAGPIVLNAMAGSEDGAAKLRNRTALLMTVGSPMGGSLPSLVADKEIQRAFQRVTSKFTVLGIQSMADDAFKAVMRPADWLSPASRSAYLTGTLRNASFALSRNEAQKKAFGDQLEVAHVAGIQDPGNFRFLPRFTAEGGTKLGIGDLANYLMLPVFQSFPLSDGMVALEHSIIPPSAKPDGVDVRLAGLLRLGHFDMAFTQPDASTAVGRNLDHIQEVPTLAIVDALFASAFDAIDTKEVAAVEPPYDPVAEQKKREADYAAANGVIIRSKYNNYCLDMPDVNGSVIYAHPCHGAANQRFILDNIDGMMSLRSAANPQKCLDAHTGEKEKKVGYLYMSPCHLHFNQQYYFGRLPNNIKAEQGMQFSEIHSGLYGNLSCLDIDSGANSSPTSNKNGRRVYFFTQCHGGENQQWMVDVAMP